MRAADWCMNVEIRCTSGILVLESNFLIERSDHLQWLVSLGGIAIAFVLGAVAF